MSDIKKSKHEGMEEKKSHNKLMVSMFFCIIPNV